MKKIAHFIVHSKAAPLIAALLCLFMWGYTSAQDNTHGWSVALPYISLLAYVLVGCLLIRINSKFDFNSKRSTFPVTLLFLCCAINPQLDTWDRGMVILLLMTSAISIILHTYRRRHSMGSYFMAFCLMSIGSLYIPQLLYLMPVLLLCCKLMQSLHIRSTFAALLGVLLPYWTAFCVLFLTDNTQRIKPFVELLTSGYSHSFTQLLIPIGDSYTLTLPTIAIQIFWLLLLITPAATTLLYTVSQRVQTRAAMFLQCTMAIALIIASLILPSLYEPLQPTIILLSALIGSTLFIGQGSRGQNIWLVILLLLWLLIASLYLWNSFSTF